MIKAEVIINLQRVMKSSDDQPVFIIYQPDPKVFHICLEVGSTYYCWWSNYPPTQDNRFGRKITRLKAISRPDIPQKQVYDKGTYTVNKGDDRAATEKKIKAGVKQRSFSFILNGKMLKGRFIIKQTPGGTILQKFKDKFAIEEDIFSQDLSRTIDLMVPVFDPEAIKLNYPKSRRIPGKSKREKSFWETEEEPAEEITADKKIGNTEYHFAFYTSDDGSELCVVSNTRNEVLVLEKDGKNWQLLNPIKGAVLRKGKELAEHAKALYQLRDKRW